MDKWMKRCGKCISGILFSHEKEGNVAICDMWVNLEGIMLSDMCQTEKDNTT